MIDREKAAKAKPKAQPNPPTERPSEFTAVAPDFEGQVSNQPSPPSESS